MQFIFNGTINELSETISIKAKEHNKDILVYHTDSNTLEIGFQRLGHNGGRFYVADISETDGKTVLYGEIRDVYPGHSQNKVKRCVDTVGDYLLVYCIFAFVPVLLWLCIFQLQHIWLPLLLPIPILVLFRIRAKKQDKKTDSDFIEFMSMFCAYTDTEVTSYEPCWDDVYRRLDLAGGELLSICDDGKDMLQISYEDGMQIDVGYLEKDKTYRITVVQKDSAMAWSKPLGVFSTNDKSRVPTVLQKVIYKFRNV
jgi:hypothetical protein